MKSFVKSKRGHGDDEVDLSDSEIYDARGMCEATTSVNSSERSDHTATFASTSTAATSSQSHADAQDEEKIEITLLPYVSTEEALNYEDEEILRPESRASGADTPSQGGSCYSYYTALSASSTTPSIESGTTAESSLYLQCDGLRLRPITPELLPNEGPEYIRMASSDSEHEEELLSSPYVESETYETRPFSLQKPVLRSLSLNRLNQHTPTLKPKLSVITQFSDPREPLRPEPTVTIFKKDKPEKALPEKTEKALPPPPPESEPEHDEDNDSSTLKTQTTGATSSTARTYDTRRVTSSGATGSQFTLLGSFNESTFHLSPISASIEHAFRADVRVGNAPVPTRPLVADFENRKSLMAVPGTPDEYIDDGNNSPPALSPDVTGEQLFPPLYTPPGAANGTAPLPVVTKLRHILPPPPPRSKAKSSAPAMPESPAIIALEATPAPAPSAYRAPPASALPPLALSKSATSAAIASTERSDSRRLSTGTRRLSRSSSRESLRSAPPKPAPTISLPPIPVKGQGSISPAARTPTSAIAHASPARAASMRSVSDCSHKTSAADTFGRPSSPPPSLAKLQNFSALSLGAVGRESPSPAPPPSPRPLPLAQTKVASPLPSPPKEKAQPKVASPLPSPPKEKEESHEVEAKPMPSPMPAVECTTPTPTAKKPRSLPPIPVKIPMKKEEVKVSPRPSLPTPPVRRNNTVRRPLPPVPKKKDEAEQLLSPIPKLPTSPTGTEVPVNATNALRKITINTAVATPIRMSLATTPVDFSADYSPCSSPSKTPTSLVVDPKTLPSLAFDAYAASLPPEAWFVYPASSPAGVEADENRVSFYHAI